MSAAFVSSALALVAGANLVAFGFNIADNNDGQSVVNLLTALVSIVAFTVSLVA